MKNRAKASFILQSAVLAMLLASSVLVTGTDLDVWQWRNPLPTGNTLNAAAFGTNTFVVAGEFGSAAVSANGTNWTTVDLGVTNAINALTYGSNLFVGVGDQGTICTSPDGVSWSVCTSGTTSRLTGVAYGNGLYIAVGSSSNAVVSADGVNWTAQMVTNMQPVTIAFGNGIFAATTAGATVASTSDGSSWDQFSLGASGLNNVVFGNGMFVVAGTIPGQFSPQIRAWTSTNGVNWPSTGENPYGAAVSGSCLVYGNGVYVYSVGSSLGGGGAQMGTSTNGATWFVQNTISAFGVNAGSFGNGKFLLVGPSGSTMLSTNATDWFFPPAGHDRVVLIQSANGATIAVGGTTLLSSTNNGPFTAYTNFANQLYSMAEGNGIHVAVGDGGYVLRSSNGLNWAPRGAGTLQSLSGVTYGGGKFVAVGSEGTIVTSPDGLVWTVRFSGSSYPLYDVDFYNNQYVAVGYFGAILTSSDAINWTVQYTDTPNKLLSVTGGNDMFVAVGQAGTILKSSNGSDWIAAVSGTIADLTSVTFGEGVFLAVGGHVLRSATDGVNWISRSPGTSQNLWGAAYLDGSFWLVGDNGTILESGISGGAVRLLGEWGAGNGAFEIRSTGGPAGMVFRLQRRDEIGGEWGDLTSFTNSTAGIYFSDPNANTRPESFYRLISP